MQANSNNAGVLPAFMDYPALGGGYTLLWQLAQTGTMTHAILLAGPAGVGKATFARTIAAMRFCESSAAPCGQCDSCRRVYSGNEPDLIEVFSQNSKPIPIDLIRDTIAQISRHSFGIGGRVVLIEPVEKLTPAAQNCLLKSLEEPPADVLFLLCAHEPSALLGTIASRCANIRLAPWADEKIESTLQAMGYTSEAIHAVLPQAGGVIGSAVAMLDDEAGQSELQSMIDRILSCNKDADAVSLSTALKDNRDGATQTLTALENAFHQALMAQTGLLGAQTIRSSAIRSWCEHSSAQELTTLIQAVFDTRKRRQSQVNWQAGIDHLLITILEAKTRWQQ